MSQLFSKEIVCQKIYKVRKLLVIVTASYHYMTLQIVIFSYISIFFNFIHQCLLFYVLKVLFLCCPQGD